MTQFNGSINLDIRESTSDWIPYAQPKAPEGSPNILYIVIDDTGFGAWDMYGGKIKMPNLNKYVAGKGLVYTNFHTTALCSPTRSSLLNGRNANSNGMACIEEATTGFPGSNGRIPFENALISEVLVERGYNTYAVGKWHLLPEEEANMASTRRHWPLGRGFERYYGFIGGETDQWYPDLVYDNHLIEPPYPPDMQDTEKGYHLSKDLVDKAIQFIQDAKAIAPEKPWLMYFCPGANHAPHHIWPEKIIEYEYNQTLDTNDVDYLNKSVFGEGYEVYRQKVFENMKALGIFNENSQLPNINPHGEPDNVNGIPEGKSWSETDYVRPWNSLTNDEKLLFTRMAEIYAAFSTYTDEQIGRLLKYLEDSGQLDNTIIIAISDNGASAEAGPMGMVNFNNFYNSVDEEISEQMKFIEKLGSVNTYNHYPTGWAWGFDAPFKYWKRWSSYEGGSATPFMISWPKCITGSDDGKPMYRQQYIHAVDLVPTLYECLKLEPPEVVKGYTQNPIEGISFKYTFHPACEDPNYVFPDGDPNRPEKVKETQFYSMLGTRGIWHQGWHACTFHPPAPSNWSNFSADKWELYDMKNDPTQVNDIAAENPEKLELLKNLWFTEADKYNGLPLDDRSTSEILNEPRPQPGGDEPRDVYTYYPGCSEVPEAVAVNIRSRSYAITAKVNFGNNPGEAKGVIFSHGGRFGGHSLYIHNKELCYVYNWLGQLEQKVSCPLPENLSGIYTFSARFDKIRTDEQNSTFGTITLEMIKKNDDGTDQTQDITNEVWSVNEGEWSGEKEFKTQSSKFTLSGEGLNVGRDGGQPVSRDYTSPSEFEGATIQNVIVTVWGDPSETNPDREFAGMLLRD